MAHYKLANIHLNENRSELHDLLDLSSAEVSYNSLPAGVGVPFVHAHTDNEEIYIVLEGRGKLFIDGEELSISQGDCFRIDPKGERCLKADDDSELRFICIQACKGSLKNFTASDAVVSQDGKKPSWL